MSNAIAQLFASRKFLVMLFTQVALATGSVIFKVITPELAAEIGSAVATGWMLTHAHEETAKINAKARVDAAESTPVVNMPAVPMVEVSKDENRGFASVTALAVLTLATMAILTLGAWITGCGADRSAERLGYAGKDGLGCLQHTTEIISEGVRDHVPCAVTRSRVREKLLTPECEGVKVAEMYCREDGGSDDAQ